jgi:pyruvate dehydrogenase E2 component (dihydrolipoamide acetyltransferase)
MAVELLMPRLGWTMEEGVFLHWLKRDGEQVQPGDLLFAIDGDKATDEIEAFDQGILRIPPDAPAPGTTLKVGALLGYIVQPGEPAPFEVERPPSDAAPAPTNEAQPAEVGSAAPAAGRATGNGRASAEAAISPRARRVANELGVAWAGLAGSGRTGRIIERDVRAAAARRQAPAAAPLRATPLARRVAEDLGVDLGRLAADAPGGRIRRDDVVQAAGAAAAPVAEAATPLSGVRRITAARLAESARTAVPVTLTTDADASELVRLRKQIAADMGASGLPAPTYNDLLLKLVAVALGEHPALNASYSDDGIVQHAEAHIGIAVDAERGLLVPVVRDVGRKSLQQIAAESTRLIAEARAGSARAADLRGGTFSISNLGMFQIDAFTPVINLPECAILGIGRIQARPVVIDEEAETVAVRRMMALSLTFDHRAVDGGPAARFLNRVREFVQRPYLWLTR